MRAKSLNNIIAHKCMVMRINNENGYKGKKIRSIRRNVNLSRDTYVNYQQDNWVQFLPMAKFTMNNYISETTGLSPFFANYGIYPKIDFKLDI
jgi:hypothetical protein